MDADVTAPHDHFRGLRALLFGLRCGVYAAGGAILFVLALIYAILAYSHPYCDTVFSSAPCDDSRGSVYIFLLPVVVGIAVSILLGRALGLPIVASMLLSFAAAGIAFATVWWPLLNDMTLPLMHADTDVFAWFFSVFVWFAVLVIVSVLWPADRSILRALRLLLLAFELALAATLISPHEVLIMWWCVTMVVVPAAAHIDRLEAQQ